MKHVVHIRLTKNDVAIYGAMMVVEDNNVLKTWKVIENRKKVAPTGKFRLVLEHSPKFNMKLWELYGTLGRSEIKIHVANYWNQLDGCLGIGMKFQDINHDGVIDVTQSKIALEEFHAAMGSLTESQITIIDLT